jgi:hypothetical protein
LTDADALCRSLLGTGWEKYLEIANNYSAFYRHDLDAVVFVKADGSVEIARPMNHPDREAAITVRDGGLRRWLDVSSWRGSGSTSTPASCLLPWWRSWLKCCEVAENG